MSSQQYTLGHVIGTGVFGTVKHITDQVTNISYAIKIPKICDVISREAIVEISSLMLFKNCRNVVTLKHLSYDFGASMICPGIILSLYDANAKQHMPRQSAQLKHAMFDICNGMLSLYNRNVYHLDLKPDNIYGVPIPNMVHMEDIL